MAWFEYWALGSIEEITVRSAMYYDYGFDVTSCVFRTTAGTIRSMLVTQLPSLPLGSQRQAAATGCRFRRRQMLVADVMSHRRRKVRKYIVKATGRFRYRQLNGIEFGRIWHLSAHLR